MNTYATIPIRVSALPNGTALSRYCMTLGESRGDTRRALMIAERWRDTPQVKATFELLIKAAVAPGTTSDATFAGPLAVHGIAGEAWLLPGRLHSRRPRRQVPARAVPHARRAGNGHRHGRCVGGEGAGTPVAATAYDTLSQEAYKAQTIVALSNEYCGSGIRRRSAPCARR